MKNGSRKVLCLFLLCLALAALVIPLNTAAKTGHGGTTKVIARIEAPSDSQSSIPPPESSPQESAEKESSSESQESAEKESSSESRPVSTGDNSPLLYGMIAAVSLGLMVAAQRRPKENSCV